MLQAVRQPKNLLAGLIFVVFGGLFLLDATSYSLGTVRRMGPGWFPTVVSSLLIVVGASIAIKSFFGERGEAPRFAWEPLAIILAALGAFTVLLRPAGVVPAVALLVIASGAAYQPRHMTLLIIGLVALAVSMTFLPLLGPVLGASLLSIVTTVAIIACVGMILVGLTLAFELRSLLRMFAAAAGIAIFCAVVFVMLLGLPMPKFGPYLDQIIDPYLITIREVTIDPLWRAVRSLFGRGA